MIGCTPNAPYRDNYQSPSAPGYDANRAVIESNAAYSLGFVEFDDQGTLCAPRQAQLVRQMVEREAGMGTEGVAGSQPSAVEAVTTRPAVDPHARGIMLVVFVHGWKWNASAGGEGVQTFKTMLNSLSEGEGEQALQEHRPARRVVGVYLGWRGLSAEWEPFEELSFWERKETAHKVGGYGAMTALLVELENIQKRNLKVLPSTQPRTELVIIGHSFGAAAVYSALSPIITERFVNSLGADKPRRLKPLGDQIILLNPAFEAMRHIDLDQMARQIQSFPPDQRPVLSIFTSRGDWATHYAFKVGRFFPSIFENQRDSSQFRASLETVGWLGDFQTHSLVPSEAPPRPTVGLSTDRQSVATAMSKPAHLRESLGNITIQRRQWQKPHEVPNRYTFDEVCLEPNPTYQPRNPFLVVMVDKAIMNGHNDIVNGKIINFLREYVLFCQQDPTDHSF